MKFEEKQILKEKDVFTELSENLSAVCEAQAELTSELIEVLTEIKEELRHLRQVIEESSNLWIPR
jgi:hypothetical protein